MVSLPNPNDYRDGVAFFHDTHKAVLHETAELERLLDDAEKTGVFQSFATHAEWEELFEFYTVIAPQHERDEENVLFPRLIPKVPRVGFQPPTAPIRFLIEGHEVMQSKMIALVKAWQAFRALPDTAKLGESHEKHQAEDAAFISTGRELAAMYREHVKIEEERVYTVADKMLSGEEKLAIADELRQRSDSESTTSFLEFERPQFSDPTLSVDYGRTDAQSAEAIDADYEDEDEEQSDV